MRHVSRWFGPILVAFLLAGCQPDQLTLEVYTSDVELAKTEVIEVTATVSFSLLGDDKDGLLDRVSDLAIPYLSPGSEFSRSKGTLGENLVIKTKIPMGSPERLTSYLATNMRLLAIELEDETAYVRTTERLPEFDNAIGQVNLMLGLDFTAKTTQVSVVSDSRETKELLAVAVFVDKKPHLIFEKTLARRDSVDLVFKGGDGSVYSEVEPQWMLLP